jgi:hypothetical protein
MPYFVLRGRWYDIIVLSIYASTEVKTDTDSIYEELERVFDKFPKSYAKMVFGNSNDEVGREDISKPTIGNESLQEISNDNEVGVRNIATSKHLSVKIHVPTP